MKSAEIRQKFFDFFIKRGHEKVASSSLIPAQDPTLLFANAGMNQFKDLFLGKEKRSYTRAVTIQKCVRAGGKHNDLDNVGFTKRHLTFFEMMGNFSFGDYFKEDAIHFAWDFLTKEMSLPIDTLHATVFVTDDEAYTIWHKEIGIPVERMHRLGAKENFWQMGDTGPCGPCTEIHIDRGPGFGCEDMAKCGPACDCDRFLEIWNLVFMQFDRQPDGSDKPLKQTGVDTGMGLERLCAVVQNVDSVYHTDLFTPIIAGIEQLTGKKYAQQDAYHQGAFHVLSDHIRSTSLLIADGCSPSNEGRGYVLRKIIRRAALFAQKLSDKNFFPELSKVVTAELGSYYPELVTNQVLIIKVLTSEIEKFSLNLQRGQAILERYMYEHESSKIISGDQTFKLYDTYGFPVEVIELVAKERGFVVDHDGFATHMAAQQAQSGKKTADALDQLQLPDSISSEFTGYHELETRGEVIALLYNNELTQEIPANVECWVITDRAPFFIVGGGQVPDQGWITVNGQRAALHEVRYIGNAIAARILTPFALKIGDSVISTVNKELRTNAMKNHTATHLLQSALIQILGKGVKQSGSLVAPDYLRFDFTYPDNLSPDVITQVENLVNEKIRENIPVEVIHTTYKDALHRGALAFFGDKYNPEQVRVIDVPGFSTELCGGTHVHATGDIGAFKITDSVALSAGHRRIFAVTGPAAIALFQESFGTVKQLSHELKVQRSEVTHAVEQVRNQLRTAATEIKKLRHELISYRIPNMVASAEKIGGTQLIFNDCDDCSTEELRDLAPRLAALITGVCVLTSKSSDRLQIFAAIAPSIIKTYDARDLAGYLKEHAQVKGGGSPTLFQGGATHGVDIAHHVKMWIRSKE